MTAARKCTIRSAKNKAVRAQNDTRDAILTAFPQLTRQDVRCAIMGERGADLVMSELAREVFPFDVEVKARAKIALIYDALTQADRGSGIPLAVVKADRKRLLAVLDLEHLIALVALIDRA